MKITSTSNQTIKELLKLKKSSYRKEKRMFLCEGEDFIKEAKLTNLGIHVYALEDKDYGIETTLVSENVLNKISTYENSKEPVILCSYKNDEFEFEDRLIYLDGVQDPGNVGTILRTALAFSYEGVIFANNSASIYSQKVISASKGSIFHIKTYENITLEFLKENGYEIIVTSLRDATDYKKYKPGKKIVLVLGNEGKGVSENSLKLASKIVKIDIADCCESLNVGVAAGILMERYR